MELKKLSEHIWYMPFEEERDRPNLGYVKGEKIAWRSMQATRKLTLKSFTTFFKRKACLFLRLRSLHTGIGTIHLQCMQ